MAWRIPFLTDWGGTPHLENLAAADAKYRERLQGFAAGHTFTKWPDVDLQTAIAAIDGWYDPSRVGMSGKVSTAEEYWQTVANWWRSPSAQYLQIDTLQKAKILDSVDSSSDAASGYIAGRDIVEHLPDFERPPIPWWVYAGGGVLVWDWIRNR